MAAGRGRATRTGGPAAGLTALLALLTATKAAGRASATLEGRTAAAVVDGDMPPLRLAPELARALAQPEGGQGGRRDRAVRTVILTDSKPKTGTTVLEWAAAALLREAAKILENATFSDESRNYQLDFGGGVDGGGGRIVFVASAQAKHDLAPLKDHFNDTNTPSIRDMLQGWHSGHRGSPHASKKQIKKCRKAGLRAWSRECIALTGVDDALAAAVAAGGLSGITTASPGSLQPAEPAEKVVLVHTQRDPIATAVSGMMYFNKKLALNADGKIVRSDTNEPPDADDVVEACTESAVHMVLFHWVATQALPSLGYDVRTFEYADERGTTRAWLRQLSDALGLTSMPESAIERVCEEIDPDRMRALQNDINSGHESSGGQHYAGLGGGPGGESNNNMRKVATASARAYETQLSPDVVARCKAAAAFHLPRDLAELYYGEEELLRGDGAR